MARLTRNSYKRKVILFGVLIFMCIALISTGFAAWVMSNDAYNDDAEGNISVGVVSDAGLSISDVEFVDNINSFVFEPKAGDSSGRVRFDATNAENLSVTVTGKISGLQNLGKFTVSLEIPENVALAAKEGYIKLPSQSNYKIEDGAVVVNAETDMTSDFDKSQSEATFSITLTFEWGDKFLGMNPAEYYDTYFVEKTSYGENNFEIKEIIPATPEHTEDDYLDTHGAKISNEECKKELEKFRAIIYGYYGTDHYFNAEGEIENPDSGSDTKYSLKSLEEDSELDAALKATYRDKIIAAHKDDQGPKFTVVIKATNSYGTESGEPQA